MQQFDNFLFHASSYSKLVTEPKSKADKDAGNLSATTKTHLREIYIEERFGRKKNIETKQMEKGILQEEAAITLYCRVTKKLWKKNTIRVENEFVTGEPDLVDNEDIMKTEEGVDIKCSWSIFTFPFADEKLSPAYDWQNTNYMFLTGAKRWSTAFCLVNAPAHQITEEKKKVYYKLNCPDDTDPEYIKKCIEVEKNMIFDMGQFRKDNPHFDLDVRDWTFDIPMKERVISFATERNEDWIASIPGTVTKSRIYLNGLVKGVL